MDSSPHESFDEVGIQDSRECQNHKKRRVTYAAQSRRRSADKITAALIDFGMIPNDDYSLDERLLLNDNVFSVLADDRTDAISQNTKLAKHMQSVVQCILSQRSKHS